MCYLTHHEMTDLDSIEKQQFEDEYALTFFKKMFTSRSHFGNFLRLTKYSIWSIFFRKWKVEDITVEEASEKYDKGELFFVDVREAPDFESVHIEGSINLKISKIKRELDLIPKDKEIAVLCYGGGVSQAAVKTLLKKGYNAKNLKGGMVRWALDVNTDFLEFL